MVPELQSVVLWGDTFRVYIDSLPKQRRLRCRLGSSGTSSDDPHRLITYLKEHGVAAQLEVETNFCGECPAFCLWNTCASIPLATLQEITNDMWRVATHTFGQCSWADITVVIDKVVYAFTWQPGVLQYFRFAGISNTFIAALARQNMWRSITPLTYQDSQVGVKLAIAPRTNLDDAIIGLVETLATE